MPIFRPKASAFFAKMCCASRRDVEHKPTRSSPRSYLLFAELKHARCTTFPGRRMPQSSVLSKRAQCARTGRRAQANASQCLVVTLCMHSLCDGASANPPGPLPSPMDHCLAP